MFVALNEQSLHGQLAPTEIDQAIRALLLLRQSLSSAECSLVIRRLVTQRPLDATGTTLEQWLRKRPSQDSLVRALRNWIDRDGPFLEDDIAHNTGATYECDDDQDTTHVVTDCGIAEAAERRVIDAESPSVVVSVAPSRWQRAELSVRCDAWPDRSSLVDNVCTRDSLLAIIERARPLRSWNALRERALARCTNLAFAEDAFEPLDPEPFNVGAANRLLERLLILDALKAHCVGASFDPEGMRLRSEHFEGKKAWFTDSSDSEKVDFRSELTFAHPRIAGEKLFCPWHAKVKTPQLRIHYYDRFSASDPLFVVYVGPKITKR